MVDQDTREQIERDVVGAPVHDCFDLHPLEHRPVDVDVHAEVLDLYSAINHE